MNVLKRGAAAVAVFTTVFAAGCSSSHHAASSGSASSTTGTSSVASPTQTPSTQTPSTQTPSASTPSAPTPAATRSPTSPTSPTHPTNATTPPPPANPPTCLSGTFAVVVPTTDNPVRTACLHLGTTVSIELLALRGVTWTTPTASDPTVATVLDQLTAPGTHHDQVRLLRPGTVTLTSHTAGGPEPSAPPSKVWTLTLTVVP